MALTRTYAGLMFSLVACAPREAPPSDATHRPGAVVAVGEDRGAPPPIVPPHPVEQVPSTVPEAERLVALQRDVDAVLKAHCSGCHPWTSMTAAHTPSICGGKGSRLVAPRDLKHSALYTKVAGEAACGALMPPAGALPKAAVATLRAWILEGAPVDGKTSPTVSAACLGCAPDDDLEVNALTRDD